MGLFRRIFSHLLPTGEAWRLVPGKYLTRFFEGLVPSNDDIKAYIDAEYLDLFPAHTRELEEWEAFYGLAPRGDDIARRQALAAEWRSTGGQSPRYIQDVLQTAGFNVFIHEWWVPGTFPRVPRDPREHTNQPQIGSIQCSTDADVCGYVEAQCDRFLVNNVQYFDNLNLTPVAPPPVPSDPSRWPDFLYFGGETFPSRAFIPIERRQEFERLVQKLKPSQQWVVWIIRYIGPGFVLVDSDEDPYVLVDDEGFVLLS